MFNSWQCLCRGIVLWFVSGLSSSFYRGVLSVVLGVFLYLRFPYFYGVMGFGGFLFIFIFPLFCCLFLSRLGSQEFFCSFIPVGSPLWVSPFVCLAETISYVIRPCILLLRPFLNLSAGAFGGLFLGGMSLTSFPVVLLLLVLFFYEVFVALVHWFIVSEILSFSVNH
uniref:ATP synthase subunit 6 n=1 Tax=Azygia robusta TaxID=3062496 RepID=A0AA50W6Y9_9TREM|nr:ATP synthase F0 subunit 6 [Azygia robusta]WMH04199.1 ATP synthase subunit 6 [Azygia robusta]WMH04211.1 ATP synthase subunit 6 [Azygia robusta]